MPLISKPLITQFTLMAQARLDKLGMQLTDITLGRDAWTVARTSGILNYCYGNTALDIEGIPGCNDAHIQTALGKVFPNAVFKDPKRY